MRGSQNHALYPNTYVWLVFVSCLDIMFTWIVLYRGGREANAIAAAVLRHFGLTGMVLFKLVLVAFLVVICESVGRRSPEGGRKFATATVMISALPVALATYLLQ